MSVRFAPRNRPHEITMTPNRKAPLRAGARRKRAAPPGRLGNRFRDPVWRDVGGFAAPILAGSLVARHGLATPLWMAAAGSLVVVLIALGLKPAPAAIEDSVALV
ncbi:MAG: hypothetical protein ACRETZ_00105 [Steroidobacteraceae bacterium]